MHDTEEMMEFLYNRRAQNLPPQALAKVFDILTWSMDNGGVDILNARHKWLQSGERGKVEIILAMEDVYPCKTKDEMITLFDYIIKCWPDLKPACEKILNNWDLQFGASAITSQPVG